MYFLKGIVYELLEQIQKHKLYLPYSQVNLIRSYMKLICLVSLVFYFPLTISFSWSVNKIYILITSIFYFIDIYFNFFTSIYIKGVYIDDIKIIQRNYFSNGFFKDLFIIVANIFTILELSLFQNPINQQYFQIAVRLIVFIQFS